MWRTVVDGATTTQTHYVFDEAGHLLAEHDGATGAVRREYVWLDDMPLAMIDSTGASPAIYWLHTGQLDEPVTMTDAGGNTVWDGFLEPFGQAQVFGAPSVDLRLPGQFAEAESGLFQNWNRNYDPSLGRYIEADPLGIEAGQNVYGYVDGDPLYARDPYGLATCVFSLSQGQMGCLPDFLNYFPAVDIPVSSGNNAGGLMCRNNPKCTALEGRGPIPLGCWRWTNEYTAKKNGRVLEACPETGTNQSERRTLLRSHSCANPFGPGRKPPFCSEGCVTGTVRGIKKLNRLIDAEPGSTLWVVP